ncbi:Hypothetical protein R9X50_00548400 [Acrodontium crateriforme]|uniref:ATP-dependent DNA helicase n=1 Tax=Acrodontium crateriforme TaxID=150365 RepID=A0AAQ3M775_9PEZI|nr:Hypothetical protein R9X50_00548400 [Acrodontium crateriforme]
MPSSDEFGLDDDDTEFIAAATQLAASQHAGGFAASPRPSKRRRLGQYDGASSDNPDSPSGYKEDALGSQGRYSISEILDQEPAGDENAPDGSVLDPCDLENEPPSPEDNNAKRAKYKIHIPTNAANFPDIFVTQTQSNLDVDPGQFRGAVWKKPAPPPPPTFNALQRLSMQKIAPSTSALPRSNMIKGQTTISGLFKRPETDEQMAARLQAEEHDLGLQRPRPREPHAQITISNANSFNASDELADLPSDAFSSSSPEKSPNKEVITISSQNESYQQKRLRAPTTGLQQMTIFGKPATQSMTASQAAKKKHAWPLKSREEAPTQHRLEPEAMKTWVYPTNLGNIRDYQFNIVSRSLFHNTLVALPTGLGKTFIAATVMLNYFRWTTDAQIIFMAPTKPLIAQQMDACYHIVGIPRRVTVLMTGETSPAIRAEEWMEKRMFFMTPQTVINDLKTGICDPKKLVLLVVDEAHKATGGYAYTEVISFVRRFNNSFRVLALTATPGSKIEAVQAVIDNLDIARVELRTEQSLDIRPYTHEKHTETELFDYTDEQSLIMDHMSKALKPTLEKLNTQNAYWSKDPMHLTAFGLTQSRQKWAQSEAGKKAPMPIKGMVQAAFQVLASLAHSIGLLKNHGIGPFYSGIAEFQHNVDSGKSKGKTATGIVQSADWVKMNSLIRGWTNNPDFIGHPKLEYLREVVLNHFLDAGEGRHGSDVAPSATRVMVFASWRDSTEEICRVLKRNEPMIRPHVFVGQAGKNGSEGMNQKKQNQVVQDFKSGKYNTLVATSIGEEGLDIGDVDLIVCYDASASPIRMLQRIGRTGRKRVGRVVLLLMRGKEENDYIKAQDNYAHIQKSIADDNQYNYHDDKSPRILPKEIQPVVDKRPIDIPVENSQPVDLNEKGRKARGKAKKRPAKKFHMPDGVTTGFVKASRIGSDAEESDEELNTIKSKGTAKGKSKAATRIKKLPPKPLPEVAQLPFLEDVLLNATRRSQLERKYAHAANDDSDPVVRPPDATRFPLALSELSSTKYMQHSRVSKRICKAFQAIRNVTDELMDQMNEAFDPEYLASAGQASMRLASSQDEINIEDDPTFNAIPASNSNYAPQLLKTRAKQTTSVPQQVPKPRGRPSKPHVAKDDDPLSTTRKTLARRAPKKRGLQRSMSYGSAAGEGDESSPEPTPANMRIGTQGIDLGSDDTSGEDEEEEPDSELDAFVARSDDPIELASSSQNLSQDFLQSSPRARHRGGLTRKHGLSNALIIDSDDDNEADIGVEDDSTDASDHDETPKAKAPAGRKRRIVDESDESE